jgi:hypothetical protein
VVSCRPKCGTRIIIRHAPRLQGATFAGLSLHQRKFSNVANEHHFLCLLGGDLRDRLGDGRNRRLTARPPLRKICVKGLVWSNVTYSCFNLPPSTWQTDRAAAPPIDVENLPDNRANSLSLTAIRTHSAMTPGNVLERN